MISVFQIYFDEITKKALEPEFIPYLNQKKDGFFENTVMVEVYKDHALQNTNSLNDYIGISSWKQRGKTLLTGKEIMAFIQQDIDMDMGKDVYLYPPIPACNNGIIQAPDIWTQHKGWGKEVYNIDILLNNSKILPFDIFDGKWNFSHCNYWIAKKEIFIKYCEQIVVPVISFFNRAEIKKITPEWYTHRHENKKYPSCSFVMEGLFGAFLAHSDYSYKYIYKYRAGRRRRDGYKIGNISGYSNVITKF